MKHEDGSRRRKILSTFESVGVRATIRRAAGYKTQIAARAACIDSLVLPLAVAPKVHITFDCDQSQDERDRLQLYRLVRRLGCTDRVRYEHRPSASEPLLAIPDAIGWAYARGGDFRRRALQLVTGIVDV